MNSCPNCNTSHLQQRSFDGRMRDREGNTIFVTTDTCPSCKGFWFDGKELDETLGLRGVVEHIARASDIHQCRSCDAPHNTPTPCPSCTQPARMRCIRDQHPMKLIEVAGVQIDVCETCRGLWLDPGELQTLHTESGAFAQPPQGLVACPECDDWVEPHTLAAFGFSRQPICRRCVHTREMELSENAHNALSSEVILHKEKVTEYDKFGNETTHKRKTSIDMGGLGVLLNIVRTVWKMKD